MNKSKVFYNNAFFFRKNNTLFIFLILLQACQQGTDGKRKQDVDFINKDSEFLNQSIEINGLTDDSKAFEYFNFINYSYFNGTNHDELITIQSVDTTRFSLKSINQSQIIEIFSFGDSTNYNTRLFVTPGDTVSMFLKNKNIDFKGKNESHYSFFKELDSSNNEWALNKFHGNFKDYKRRCDSIYNRRKLFFKEYILNNRVSDDFILHVDSELKFEYFYNLIAPRDISTESGLAANSNELILLISLFNDTEKCGFFDFKDYLGPITIEDFQNPKLIHNDYFKRSLSSFIRYYFAGSSYLNYTRENFEDEQKYIQNNLKGEIKEYALTKLVYDYYKKGFGQGKVDGQFVKDFINIQKSALSNSSYKEALILIEEQLNLEGYPLTERAVDDRLLSVNGDTLKFADILKTKTSKIKVLDFWANWCSLCISEIKKTSALRKKLKTKNDLEWIFISIDDNNNKWINRYEELKFFFENKSHYRLLDANNSQVINFLTNDKTETFLIPRYVILDKNNQVLVSHAPRPSDSILFRSIIDRLKI